MGKKISQLLSDNPASALDGSEGFELIQGGVTKGATANQIKAFASPGSSYLVYASVAEFPAEGATDKIYGALDTGFTYTWANGVYVASLLPDGTIVGATLQPQEFTKGISSSNPLTEGDLYGAYINPTIAEGDNLPDFPVYYADLIVNGNTGNSNSSSFRAKNTFNSESETGTFTCFHSYPPTTQEGATIANYEGFSQDAFMSNADITNLYAYYFGGLTPGGTGEITNMYGVYLEDVSGASADNYAIYTKLGKVRLGGLQNFANNAAAISGGLVAGDFYYTDVAGDGILKIVI